MLNAELTWEPSRKSPYLLGVVILIIVKFPKSPSAIFAILFRLEFEKLGTSAFRDTLWNFGAQTIWEKPFKLLKNLALGSLWKLGFLAGVPFNRPLSIQNYFPDALEDLLFGACLAIGKYLESFCRNIIAIASGKRSVSRGFCSHFLLLLIT